MSVATVKAHVSRLLVKLGVENRVQIALLVQDATRRASRSVERRSSLSATFDRPEGRGLRAELHHLVDAGRLVRVLHGDQRQRREGDLLRAPRARATRPGRGPAGAARRLRAASSAAHSSFAHVFDACPCRSSAGGRRPRPSGRACARRSFHMYWCQPPYWPPGGWSKRADAPLELLAQRGAEAVAQPGVGEALPRGVEDRHAGVVDLAVAVGVARGCRRRRARPAAGRRPACRARAGRLAAVEHRLQRRPQLDDAHVLGRGGVGRGQDGGQRLLGLARRARR